jgi:hypothetical protein
LGGRQRADQFVEALQHCHPVLERLQLRLVDDLQLALDCSGVAWAFMNLKKTKLWRQDELLRFSVQRMALNKTTDSCFIC